MLVTFLRASRHLFRETVIPMLLTVNLTATLLVAAALQVSANGWGQITLSEKNTPLPKVLKEIERQSGYDVIYTYELLEHKGNVTIDVRNASLPQALDACLKGKRLSYRITNQTVVIVDQPPASNTGPPDSSSRFPVNGTVRDREGQPVANVSVMIKGTSLGTTTDAYGRFAIQAEPGQTLIISYVGYESQEIRIAGGRTLVVELKENSKSMMDQAVVIGYGTIKKADLTGAVAVLDAKTSIRMSIQKSSMPCRESIRRHHRSDGRRSGSRYENPDKRRGLFVEQCAPGPDRRSSRNNGDGKPHGCKIGRGA